LGIAKEHGYTKEEGLEYQRIVAFIVANGIPAPEGEKCEQATGLKDPVPASPEVKL
jgi:hypothetical protein